MKAQIRFVHYVPDPYIGDKFLLGAYVDNKWWPSNRWKPQDMRPEGAGWLLKSLLVGLQTWNPAEDFSLAPSVHVAEPMALDVDDPIAWLESLVGG